MKGKTIFLIGVIMMALTACQAEPETIIETVVHEVTVEVPQTVEVTRQVEVELEVTRQVEVTKEVPVEVTRVVEVEVEVVVTATPAPTTEPTTTPTQAPAAIVPPTEAAPAPDLATSLLQASQTLRNQLYRFRDQGMNAGDCYIIVESDDYFNSAPGFDVSGSDNDVQTANAYYQEALTIAKDATLGISQGCRDAIANQQGFTITYLNLLDIVGKADTAIGKVDVSIGILEPLVGE